MRVSDEKAKAVFGNRYRVVDPVGSGGMATVYRGVDSLLGRDVAIKVMHPHLASRADARARFSREARSIARLKHPNIVDVYDFSGDSDLDSYIVTEFVHGLTLTEFANRHGPLLPPAAALLGHAIAGAMAHAHGAGLVHRDIKPDNLMIAREGAIKLMDFGIATAMDMEQMTATGAILGSPAHMAPEQIEGRTVDARADIFAFGTVMYTLATGKLPFVASNPHALFRLILECQYTPPSRVNPVIDRDFEEILVTAMAREPGDRWSSMAAVQQALAAYLQRFELQDVATHLPRLLQAPEQFQLALRPKLVKALCEDGKSHAQDGNLALAIDCYNRALAVDPDADEPRAGLTDLTSRSRRRRQFRAAFIVAAGALASTAVLFVALQPRAEPPPPTPTRALPIGVPAAPDALRMAAQEAVDARRRETEALRQKRMIESAANESARLAAQAVARQTGEASDNAARAAAQGGGSVRRPSAGGQVARVSRPKAAPSAESPAGADAAPVGAGPTQATTPSPREGLIEVVLGSVPAIAVLYLDGDQISVTGYRRMALVSGREYRLRCEPHVASCQSCPPFLEVRFRVPEHPTADGTVPTAKCDFRPFVR